MNENEHSHAEGGFGPDEAQETVAGPSSGGW